MTRPIKFRAWCKGEMIYPELNLFSIKNHYDQPDRFMFSDGEIDGNFSTPEAVTQFTGLLDKNGKEIYEGDIVQVVDEATGKPYHEVYNGRIEPFVVEWKDHGYNFGFGFKGTALEVIGNIYENSELLK